MLTQTGLILCQYRDEFGRVAKCLSLGQFPDLTLAQARENIPQLRQRLNEGQYFIF